MARNCCCLLHLMSQQEPRLATLVPGLSHRSSTRGSQREASDIEAFCQSYSEGEDCRVLDPGGQLVNLSIGRAVQALQERSVRRQIVEVFHAGRLVLVEKFSDLGINYVV